jgi:hypothetical protein
MAEQMRPASPEQAPDPADNYERSKPENEAGMGRLDNDVATPTNDPDRQEESIKNRQDPQGQLNAQDVTNARQANPPACQPDHSMHDEEPDGWDLAPHDIQNPRGKRHPRTEGRGGTP